MPDQKFRRDGNDIHTNVTVSFKEAILGAKVTVNSLSRTVAVTIPPGTQPGTRLRLKGLGLSVGDQSGDLYVTVDISIPTELTDEQRRLLEEW